MKLSLDAIVQTLGGELWGSGSTEIGGITTLETAGPSDLSFLSNPRYQSQLQSCRAACVIVGMEMREVARLRGPYIATENPYLYFAKLTQLWKRLGEDAVQTGVHASAVIHPTAWVHPSASVGALCVVERGARIGAETILRAQVTIGERCMVGERCILHSGVVVGADGFGFAPDGERWEKIEQLGAVRIGNDVEIGANTCIDRGALQDTVIEDGVKLDNLIQIGHNVHIGRNTAMAGCAGVAGSATIGPNCTVGGGAIILGHLKVGEGVHVSAASVVSRTITKPGHYTGMFPIDENAVWERNAATLKQLHKLRERIKILEKEKSKP
jgi:UDP-3-O-[3-hydroxymyristoyl] glucosamine N-acyltransferase